MIRFCVYLILRGALTARCCQGATCLFNPVNLILLKVCLRKSRRSLKKLAGALAREKAYPVFAVNHDGGTFFADENGLMVSFDGWQIRQVSISQSKDGKIAVIEKTTTDDGVISLDYSDGNARRLAQDNCQAWERTTGTAWKQDCKIAKKCGQRRCIQHRLYQHN